MANSLSEKIYALFSSTTNKKLIKALDKRGKKVFLFPPIKSEKIALDNKQTKYLRNISDFDWLIFTDVFTVKYFLESLEENEIDFFEMDAVNVCAFGEAVSDTLRFVQLHADLIPNLIETEEVFSALSGYLYENELNDMKFLLVKEFSQNYKLKEKLIEKGANVTELPIYTTKITDKNEIAKLKTLLKGGAIDEFVFSSPSDFTVLQFYSAGEAISNLLSEIQISVTSEIVFQAAKEHNLRPLYFHL
ncbi:MAG: uroporphyrinogen-III synthase [Acidobacteria bacterium]|nr:uroporphyrinogen-III synthase [Acidobacteriota bacterium]MCA1636942.1 uroporphyrinogen-III synthase [Acidobacteriota bacterium]